LEPGAIACVECGTRIGQPVEAADGSAQGYATSTTTLAPNRNTLSYQEDRNSRRFEASLTDSAMHGLGDVFGELFARAGTARVTQPNGARTFIKDVVIDETKQLPPVPLPDAEPVQVAPEASAQKPPVDKERILRIFSVNGETLELTDNRLKATTAADYYRRLSYLVLYANELHGRPVTPRADLTTILKEAKVYDTNCRTWLKKKDGFTVDQEDRLKLNARAREHAVRAIDDALNTSMADEWNPDTKATKNRATRKKKA